MIAYLIGGPHDLSKRVVMHDVASLQFPTREIANHDIKLPVDTNEPRIVMSHYRRFRHELEGQFLLFYYEGSW